MTIKNNNNRYQCEVGFAPLLGLRDIAHIYVLTFLERLDIRPPEVTPFLGSIKVERIDDYLGIGFIAKVNTILFSSDKTNKEKVSILYDIDMGKYDEDLLMGSKKTRFTRDDFLVHPVMRRRDMAIEYVNKCLRTAKRAYDENQHRKVQYLEHPQDALPTHLLISSFIINVEHACCLAANDSVSNAQIDWLIGQIKIGLYDRELFNSTEQILFLHKPGKTPWTTIYITANSCNYVFPDFNLDDKSDPITNPQEENIAI